MDELMQAIVQSFWNAGLEVSTSYRSITVAGCRYDFWARRNDPPRWTVVIDYRLTLNRNSRRAWDVARAVEWMLEELPRKLREKELADEEAYFKESRKVLEEHRGSRYVKFSHNRSSVTVSLQYQSPAKLQAILDLLDDQGLLPDTQND